MHIFITHSNKDEAKASRIRDLLENEGIKCWMAPRDIPVGEEWAEAILNGIESASGMLLVFSSHSNDSPQVRREIERAIHKSIPIFPVRVEDVQPSRAMEYYISTHHWMDLFSDDLDSLCKKLAKTIEAKVGRNLVEGENTPEEAKLEKPFVVSESEEWICEKSRKMNLKKYIFVILAVLLLCVFTIHVFSIIQSGGGNTIAQEHPFTEYYSGCVPVNVCLTRSNEYDDKAMQLLIAENGDCIIMGYSYTNEEHNEGYPWISRYAAEGTELWTRCGSSYGFDGRCCLHPDGYIIWAYVMSDTSLLFNKGYTKYVLEILSPEGNVLFSECNVIPNTFPYYGKNISINSMSYGHILDVQVHDNETFVTFESYIVLLAVSDGDAIEFLSLEGNARQALRMVDIRVITNVQTTILSHQTGPLFEMLLQDSIESEPVDIMKLVTEDIWRYETLATSNPLFDNDTGYIFISPNVAWDAGAALLSFRTTSVQANLEQRQLCVQYRRPKPVPTVSRPISAWPILRQDSNNLLYLFNLLTDASLHVLITDEYGRIEDYRVVQFQNNSFQLCDVEIQSDSIYIVGCVYSESSSTDDGVVMVFNLEGDSLCYQAIDFGGDEAVTDIEVSVDGKKTILIESDLNRVQYQRDIYLASFNQLESISSLADSSSIMISESWATPSYTDSLWPESIQYVCRVSDNTPFSERFLATGFVGPVACEIHIPIRSGIRFEFEIAAASYVNHERRDWLRFGVYEISNDSSEIVDYVDMIMQWNDEGFVRALSYSESAKEYEHIKEIAAFTWLYSQNRFYSNTGAIQLFANGPYGDIDDVLPDSTLLDYGLLNNVAIEIDSCSVRYLVNSNEIATYDLSNIQSDSIGFYIAGKSFNVDNAIGEINVQTRVLSQ